MNVFTPTIGKQAPGRSRSGQWLWPVLIIVLVTLLQLYIPYPVDDDTAYHFSVGQLIGRYGLLHQFPWTTCSWQFDHYADKELLFHLLFTPLGGLGFVGASRVVGIVCGSAALLALFGILSREQVRWAGIWAIVPLGCAIFVYRFSQVRPHLLSIALALVFIWAFEHRRLVPLALVSLLYPLTYVAFWQIPLLLVAAAETARLVNRRRFSPQPLLVVLVGIAVGLALHPNARNLLSMNWIHMRDVLLRNAWGSRVEFNLGEEFEPLSPGDLFRFLGVSLAMTGIAAGLVKERRHAVPQSLTYLLATLFFGVLTLRTHRFLEYFVPFAALALAVADRERPKAWLLPAVVGALLLTTVLFGRDFYVNLGSFNLKNWYMEPEVAREFAREIPEGAQVFTCGWEYTGSLLLNLPERRFMVALDPTLFYARDARLYDIWYRTLLDAPNDAAAVVRREFGSRYAVCQNYPALAPFFTSLTADPDVRVLFANEKWLLFDLDGRRP